MVSIRFVAALTCLSLFKLSLAIPLASKLRSLSPGARDVLKRTTPAAPRFVIYQDTWTSTPPAPSSLQGYNVYALCFLMTGGAVDMAQSWAELTSSQRSSYINEYNAAGIDLVVSAFGSTNTPTSSGDDPVVTANNIGAWVKQYGVQGVDVDYEDFDAFNSGVAANWLISFTQQLRTQLPQSQYTLTHAPVAPWFAPGLWSDGGYLAVDKAVGSFIDFYNIQFYNQGSSEYTTCDGLLNTAGAAWPGSALFQIAANGVDVNKLLIGKPATGSDASNGYMDPSTLASCVAQAHSSGWSGGVMVWQYPHADSSWIQTVRGSTWPVSGSSPPIAAVTLTAAIPPGSGSTTTSSATTSSGSGNTDTSPTTTTSSGSGNTTTSPTTTTSSGSGNTTTSPTTTAPSGSGNCAGVSAWASGTTYVGGNQVTYNGDLWTAKWWTEGDVPGSSIGAWTDDGPCN